jgi:hypothetical protein
MQPRRAGPHKATPGGTKEAQGGRKGDHGQEGGPGGTQRSQKHHGGSYQRTSKSTKGGRKGQQEHQVVKGIGGEFEGGIQCHQRAPMGAKGHQRTSRTTKEHHEGAARGTEAGRGSEVNERGTQWTPRGLGAKGAPRETRGHLRRR